MSANSRHCNALGSAYADRSIHLNRMHILDPARLRAGKTGARARPEQPTRIRSISCKPNTGQPCFQVPSSFRTSLPSSETATRVVVGLGSSNPDVSCTGARRLGSYRLFTLRWLGQGVRSLILPDVSLAAWLLTRSSAARSPPCKCSMQATECLFPKDPLTNWLLQESPN